MESIILLSHQKNKRFMIIIGFCVIRVFPGLFHVTDKTLFFFMSN